MLIRIIVGKALRWFLWNGCQTTSMNPGPSSKLLSDILSLKECAQQLSIPLFSKSFNSTSLPLAWKEALVTPIYKKGDRTAVSNYRPISLTSPIIKIMELIIRDQIQKCMTTNNLFRPNKHGFSSVTQCSQFLDIICWGEPCNWYHIFWLGSPQMLAC